MTDQPTTGSNMELWEKLRRVDPNHSKAFQRAGGFRGTAVKPSEQERLMTETFGPIGFGWGMTKPEYKEVPAGIEVLVYCTVGVWYRWNDEKSDIFWGEGGDKIVTVRKNGDVSADDEARKKSLTDAIGNALKRIGMAADIHMGFWDDSKYREENEKFFVSKRPDLQPDAIEESEADLKERLDAVTDLDTLDDLWKSGVNSRINQISVVDKVASQRMIFAFSQKKNEIIRRDERTVDAEEPAEERPPATVSEEVVQDHVAPKPPATVKQDDLTPEKIGLFGAWLERKLASHNNTENLTSFWKQECLPRVDLIEKVDKKAYSELNKLYIKRLGELDSNVKNIKTHESRQAR